VAVWWADYEHDLVVHLQREVLGIVKNLFAHRIAVYFSDLFLLFRVESVSVVGADRGGL